MKLFAEIISYVFSPPAWVFYFLVVSIQKGLFSHAASAPNIILVASLLLIPFLYLFYLLGTHKITDIDISVRRQRYGMLILLNTCCILLLAYFHSIHLREIFYLTSIFFIILLLTSVITLLYKISFHMTATITFTLFIAYLYHYSFDILFIFLTIPLIFWSRLYLKQHTVKQLLLAIFLDAGIIGVFLR